MAIYSAWARWLINNVSIFVIFPGTNIYIYIYNFINPKGNSDARVSLKITTV